MKQQIKRILRRLAGRDWYPSLELRLRCERFGSPTAGWTVAADYLNSQSIVWCVGIGEDISFDLALMRRFRMPVHAFDPTPKSLAWVRKQNLPADYFVHPLGLADRDGVMHFQPPDNPDFVSHRLVESTAGGAANSPAGNLLAVEVRRIGTLAASLSHARIDLLKMDIEGAEYAVIRDLQHSPLLPGQLLVEFHHRMAGIGLGQTKSAVRSLQALGYRLFHVSPNGEEYAFLHRDQQTNGP